MPVPPPGQRSGKSANTCAANVWAWLWSGAMWTAVAGACTNRHSNKHCIHAGQYPFTVTTRHPWVHACASLRQAPPLSPPFDKRATGTAVESPMGTCYLVRPTGFVWRSQLRQAQHTGPPAKCAPGPVLGCPGLQFEGGLHGHSVAPCANLGRHCRRRAIVAATRHLAGL